MNHPTPGRESLPTLPRPGDPHFSVRRSLPYGKTPPSSDRLSSNSFPLPSARSHRFRQATLLSELPPKFFRIHLPKRPTPLLLPSPCPKKSAAPLTMLHSPAMPVLRRYHISISTTSWRHHHEASWSAKEPSLPAERSCSLRSLFTGMTFCAGNEFRPQIGRAHV